MGSPVVDEVRPLEDDSLTEWGVDDKEWKNEIGYDWHDSDVSLDDVSHDTVPPLAPDCCHQVDRTEAQFESAPRYTETFPISIQDFYLNFLSDSSDAFWTKFHSGGGYTDFAMTKWSLSLEGCCIERQTDFRAPLRMSVATKHTRVSQRQRCRFSSPDEIIFETSSHSRNVPYSNQFLVEAVWKLTNIPDGGCELNIYVFVRFTKKNWLKGMIERNAIDGSRDWFENWMYSALAVANHLKHNSSVPHSLRTSTTDILAKSIQHHPHKVDLEEQSKESTHGMNRSAKTFMIILIAIAGLLFITSIYLFWQSRTFSNELEAVTAETNLLEENFFKLRTAISLTTTDADILNYSHHDDTTNLELWKAQLRRLENIVYSIQDIDDFSLSEMDEGDSTYYQEITATMTR